MTFTKFLPVALMVAIIAALYVFVANWLMATYEWTWIALWVPFISWPLYFLVGAKPVSRIGKEVIGLTGGVFFGWLTLAVLVPFANVFGSSLALPAIVFCVAFIILVLELTDWFELAPAYFFAYAAYFAYYFGGVGGFYPDKAAQAMWPVWVLLMVGLILGFLTATWRKKLLEKAGLYGPDQKTVFDKEK